MDIVKLLAPAKIISLSIYLGLGITQTQSQVHQLLLVAYDSFLLSCHGGQGIRCEGSEQLKI